jgi:hypothetical protein
MALRGWGKIVAAAKTLNGERWDAFRGRRGDCDHDLTLYVARHYGGTRLRELAEASGGFDYGSRKWLCIGGRTAEKRKVTASNREWIETGIV